MKWKWIQQTGFLTMMNNHDAPGTVVIRDEIGGEVTTLRLKQLDPNQGEQQLGIIMPLDGNFKQEKLARWQ